MTVRRIQLRRGQSAEWATVNPILAPGEEGYELDTGQRKVGDGSTPWNQLPYTTSKTSEIAFFKVAHGTLSGHRAVTPRDAETVEYATNSDVLIHRPVWLTTSSAVAGDLVQVHVFGSITESSWNWIPGRQVWLGIDGALTQIVPSAPAALVQLGVAESPETLFFDPKTPIKLT